MKKITLLIAFMLSLVTMGYGQTVLISPTGDGGFANGTTFPANGWTVVNSANNPWVVGTAAASGAIAGNAAYVSNNAGVAANYTNNVAAVNYFYRDVTVPAGETKITLTFNWTGTGEDNYDHFQVLTAPTTVTPVASTSSASTFSGTPVPSGVTGATSIGIGTPQTGVQTATYNLPATLAGTTFRLIFSWRNDTSGGVSPAAAIDNISLTSFVPFNAIASGNWNNPAIWNKGVVPTCTDEVNIVGGFNVTVNSAANVAKNVIIASGSTLTVASGDLTVGCTLKNNTLANSGTLTVSGGTLNINGNMLHNAASTFNQSGGSINVDGNDGGNAATSVASGTSIVQLNSQFISWTGGTLTIVDPHANSTASNTLTYTNSTANVDVTTGHTLRLGDGTSADAGGNTTNGFRLNTYASSNRISFNNLVINGGAGTNRFVSTTYSFGVNGDFTVNANSVFRDSGVSIYFTKNLINNGIYVCTGTAYFGTFLNATAGISSNAQTVSGAGVFSNNNTVASATANFASVTINNSNAAGVTFPGTTNIASQPANSVSVSGTLTFNAGKIATLGGAPFILGNSTPSAGTLSYTSGGFVSGTTFGRWFTATGAGTTITAAADATGAAGRYPFINSLNLDRSASIERNTPAAAAGVLAVTYTAATGSSVISATDGAATVDKKGNDTWAVSVLSGTPTAAASLELQLLGSGTFGAPLTAANTRIIQGATFVGTHQGGTVTPGGQRLLTPTEIVSGPFSLAAASADLPYVSVASGDWNTPATWSSGVVPTCNDVVNIGSGHTVTVTTAGAVSKNVIVAAGGTLTVASGDLTVGCTSNNNTLTVNGTLNVNGGTVNVNGNINAVASSVFNQTGGTIKIDGNAAGVVENSVASGTALFNIATTNISLTGGTLLIVDPHVGTTNSSAYAINFTNGTPSVTSLLANAAHTTQFGDSVSTDAGGNTSGFYVNAWASSAYLSFGSMIINGGSGTNRGVNFVYQLTTNGNLTVNTGNTLTIASLIIGGNLNVAGTLINTTGVVSGVVSSNTGTGLSFGPTTLAQTFTATGAISNLAASPTANFTALTVNNTNAAGLTLANPFSVSGTLTLTAGKVNTTTANLLTVGTATAAGTITGGSATAYVAGPLARTIATSNAITNYIAFPVGKAAYAPIAIAPATTTVTVMKAEAFDTNTGTANPSIINLAANRRWEAPIVSGTVGTLNVRLGDTGITATRIPVQAPTAEGAYTSAFGSSATYAAGTPNTTTSTTAIAVANYTGFLSYADSNVCSGTPAPGNTIASANNICGGTSVTFSVQNPTVGTGVTYQWQSSSNGTAFTDIANATNATYVTVPSESLYYRLNVTCSTGPATGASTPVQITFTNNLTSTTGATRCGAGSVSLAAAAATGTIRWFDVATAGTILASGPSFSTDVTATKTFYASTEVMGTATAGGARVGTTSVSNTTASEYGLVFNATSSFVLNSVDVYLTGTSAGNLVMALKNSAGVQLQTITVPVPAGNATTPVQYTVNLGWTIPPGTDYRLLAISSTGMVRESSLGGYPYAIGSAGSVTNGYINGTSSTYYYFYNWNFTPFCSSPRVPVVATVNPAPVFTLSGNPAAICAGQTTAAVTVTAGAADYTTFTWTPSAGVAGSAATGWTFNPSVSTAYTLQASNATCNAVPVTVNVIVNQLPAVLTAPATVAACVETVTPLTATGGMTTITPIGTATTKTTATEELSVFGNRRINYKIQTIYTAAELVASGVEPGNINSVAYFVDSVGDADNNPNYTIRIGTTTNAVFPGTAYLSDAAFTPVYGPAAHTHVVGENVITFTTPFVWDGVSNIVVQLTYDGENDINNAQTFYTDSGANTTLFGYNTPTTGTLGTKRFNTRFNSSFQNPVTWSPVTNLYTNAAATTAYVAGTNATTVYFKSNTAAPAVAYTATATNTSGCVRTATVNVSVSSTPAPTVPAATQEFCNAGTVADLVATGTGIKWYAAATGGAALTPATAIVNNTQYFASQTIDGCESLTRTGRTAIINVIAAPTVADNTPEFCNAATVANLQATGTAIKWYAAATGGAELAGTTALVSGTPYYASQTINGCEGLLRTEVTPTVNVTPTPTVDAATQTFCNAGTVADLTVTGTGIKWYTALTGGTEVAATDALVNGTPYYASQTIDGCESIGRVEKTAIVNVVVAPTVDAATQTFCNAGTVAELTANGTGIKWYDAETAGNLVDGATALINGNIYYASQTIDGCEGLVRVAKTAVINVVVAPTADDEQEFCDAAIVDDLVANGTGIQWYDAETGGNLLTGDADLVNGNVYYASQTIEGCEGLTRVAVTAVIHNVVADAPTDVNVCSSYELPVLTSGAYFTEPNGAGAELAAGTAITVTTTLYVFAQTGTDVVCSDENSFTITVANIPAPTGEAVQSVSVNQASEATIEDLTAVAIEGGTITWYETEEDAAAGTNPIAAGTVITDGTYFAVQTVGECSGGTFEVTVSIVLGRDGFDAKALQVYPNPVKDVLNISYSTDITSVSVFNMLGQQVMVLAPNATAVKLDMSSLADAPYVVNITVGNTVKTVKVVKKQ